MQSEPYGEGFSTPQYVKPQLKMIHSVEWSWGGGLNHLCVTQSLCPAGTVHGGTYPRPLHVANGSHSKVARFQEGGTLEQPFETTSQKS